MIYYVGCESLTFYPLVDRHALLAEVGLAGQTISVSSGHILPSKGADLVDNILVTCCLFYKIGPR